MARPIRVLYLIDQIYSTRGGAEQHLHWLLRKLPDIVFDKYFAVLSRVCRTDVSQWPVPGMVLSERFGAGPANWWRRVNAVRDLLHQRAIDIIHTFCPMSELAAVCATHGGRTAKVIGVRRNTGYALRPTGAWRSWLISPCISNYLANSEVARQVAVLREGLAADRFDIIPNPISSERLNQHSSVNRCHLAASHESIVVMVATVRPIKDYPTFLRAARLVVERREHVRFLAIGEKGNDFAELQELANSLSLNDRMRWLGGLDNPIPILRHADVGVLTSRSESFSNAVLEYAAAGLPAVVTDVGGLREIVLDGESGYVVPSGSPELVAERVLALLANAELRVKFGERARAHVEQHFSEGEIIGKYVDFYRSMTCDNCAERR